MKYVGANYVLEINGNGIIVSKNDDQPNGETFTWEEISNLFRQLQGGFTCESRKNSVTKLWSTDIPGIGKVTLRE